MPDKNLGRNIGIGVGVTIVVIIIVLVVVYALGDFGGGGGGSVCTGSGDCNPGQCCNGGKCGDCAPSCTGSGDCAPSCTGSGDCAQGMCCSPSGKCVDCDTCTNCNSSCYGTMSCDDSCFINGCCPSCLTSPTVCSGSGDCNDGKGCCYNGACADCCGCHPDCVLNDTLSDRAQGCRSCVQLCSSIYTSNPGECQYHGEAMDGSACDTPGSQALDMWGYKCAAGPPDNKNMYTCVKSDVQVPMSTVKNPTCDPSQWPVPS